MTMPGMLTDAQMAQLDSARGVEFDRLFMTFMIQHHRGAITMVDSLFNTPGAAQDEIVFKFANDVQVDQTTEIDRMEQMLEALPPAKPERRCTEQLSPIDAAGFSHSVKTLMSNTPRPRSASSRFLVAGSSRPRRRRGDRRRLRRRVAPARCRRAPEMSRDARHVCAAHRRAVARSARRAEGRAPRRRRSDLEHAHDLAHAIAAGLRRDHELRPRLLRHQRHPGQLQWLRDLGYLEPVGAALRVGEDLPGIAERRLGL